MYGKREIEISVVNISHPTRGSSSFIQFVSRLKSDIADYLNKRSIAIYIEI